MCQMNLVSQKFKSEVIQLLVLALLKTDDIALVCKNKIHMPKKNFNRDRTVLCNKFCQVEGVILLLIYLQGHLPV